MRDVGPELVEKMGLVRNMGNDLMVQENLLRPKVTIIPDIMYTFTQ